MNEEQWKKIGGSIIFDPNEHLIWKIVENDDEISAPEGYEEIKTDKVTYLKKIYVRKFFVNTVPVKAELYKNSITKERAYFFEGVPVKILGKGHVK